MFAPLAQSAIRLRLGRGDVDRGARRAGHAPAWRGRCCAARRRARARRHADPPPARITLASSSAIAFARPQLLLLNLGFFTCGFHIAFLVTHLPREVGLCGLPPTVASWSLAIIGLANIAGSLAAGWPADLRMKIPVVRDVRSPRRRWSRCTWWRRRPPDLLPVRRRAGPHLARHRAADRGDRRQALRRALSSRPCSASTLFSHQIGGFFGAWLGGIASARSGDYKWMWYADIALGAAAAIINLPIREAKINGVMSLFLLLSAAPFPSERPCLLDRILNIAAAGP